MNNPLTLVIGLTTIVVGLIAILVSGLLLYEDTQESSSCLSLRPYVIYENTRYRCQRSEYEDVLLGNSEGKVWICNNGASVEVTKTDSTFGAQCDVQIIQIPQDISEY